MNVSIEELQVTPVFAEKLLGTQVKNRRLNTRRVALLAQAMERGTFGINGSTIVVDADGHLVDGQHRLQAIIKSTLPQTLLIVKGVASQAQATIDTGYLRTAGNVLSMEGFVWPSLMAAMAKLVILHDRGELTPGIPVRNVSNEDVLNFCREHDNSVTASMRQWGDKSVRAFWEPSSATACHYMFHRANPDVAERVFDGLRTGADLHENSVILQFRNRMLRSAMQAEKFNLRQSSRRWPVLALAFVVFNRVASDREHGRLVQRSIPDTLPDLIQ